MKLLFGGNIQTESESANKFRYRFQQDLDEQWLLRHLLSEFRQLLQLRLASLAGSSAGVTGLDGLGALCGAAGFVGLVSLTQLLLQPLDVCLPLCHRLLRTRNKSR